ncbi:hypothetical protein ACPEIC_11125 [Stenotrophomonas sp. NPDC087984]
MRATHLGEGCTVLIEHQALDEFLEVAVGEYQRITSETPLPCFALLVGSVDHATFTVERVAFGRNARTTDPAARREFTESIVPLFGSAYENETRGWWIDSHDLLRASREAEADGLEILGSVHMHPDWHRVGPPEERKLILSERPTPMDQHVFGNTGWPVNLICYLERRGDVMYHALAAWAPPPPENPHQPCAELPLRIRTNAVVAV